MTTPVETKTAATTVTKAKTVKRKPAVKREFNELGKFFAKIRIDADLTTAEWAKALGGVSQLMVTNIERGETKMSFDYAMKAVKVVREKAPHYLTALVSVIAGELGVLVIPQGTSGNAVEAAYRTLVTFNNTVAEVE